MGLYCLAVAIAKGADRVFVFGAPESRLEVAARWGAAGTMNIEQTSAADRKAWLAERTRGLGVDVVIQAATAQAIPEAVDLVRRGGRIVSIGGGSGNLEIPAFAMTTKYLTITSVLQAEARHFLQAVQFLSAQSKHFPFESMITGSYSLENTTEALQAMSEFREVKPVVLPQPSAV